MLSEPKQRYIHLCETRPSLRLYESPWWWDAVCGEAGWKVSILETEEGMACLPYCTEKIRGLRSVITPPLTQWISLLGDMPDPERHAGALLKAIPPAPILDLSFNPVQQIEVLSDVGKTSLRYSHLLAPPVGGVDISAGYNSGLKRTIRMAADHFSIEHSEDTDAFTYLSKSVYAIHHLAPPAWMDSRLTLLPSLLRHQSQGTLLIARENNTPVASLLMGEDDNAVYYLVGGRIKSASSLSASAYLLDCAIREAHSRHKVFDFEGSMVPGIASFFQSFGASPVPYRRIQRYTGWGKIWSLFQ